MTEGAGHVAGGEARAGAIYARIPAIMAELEAIGRTRRNEQQRFMYRGIDDLYNALQPLLAKHGVFTVPEVLSDTRSERQSKSGGTLLHVVARIRYRFYASDGSYFDAILIGEGMDSGDKASNKAESVAHKYALTQVFAVRTEDQPDPDGQSPAVGGKASPKKEVGVAPPKTPAPPPPPTAKPAAAAPAGKGAAAPTQAQLARLFAIAHQAKWPDEELKLFIETRFGRKSTKELTRQEYDETVMFIEAHPYRTKGPP